MEEGILFFYDFFIMKLCLLVVIGGNMRLKMKVREFGYRWVSKEIESGVKMRRGV